MIPSPIHKVLSTLSCHAVRHLLMGGQACVLYGGAEFSRDCDIVIVTDAANLANFRSALKELDAHCIAVPPFDPAYLERGHAVHFRCHAAGVERIRIDVMSRLRGCDDFHSLWSRRTSVEQSDGTVIEVLSLADLVQAKKTQRDKDWPMIRRLIDAHFEQFASDQNESRARFWLTESRSPDVLCQVAAAYPELVRELIPDRPLLQAVIAADDIAVQAGLRQEEATERSADQEFWRPLKFELEQLRMSRRETP